MFNMYARRDRVKWRNFIHPCCTVR